MKIKTFATDVLIIGAGQAGLVAAHFLQQKKIPFLLVDSNQRTGDSWRSRYDSLQLLTPWNNNMLSGFSPNADKNSYPTKDEFADYLEQYAKHFLIPIYHKTTVEKLTKKGDTFIADTKVAQYRAKKVIVATGPFQVPYIPSNLGVISKKIFQLHSVSYRNAKQIRKKKILVVGGGGSGIQIGIDFSHNSYVTIAESKKLFFTNKYDLLYSIISKLVPISIVRLIVGLLGIRKIHTPGVEELLRNKKIIIKSGLIKIDNNKFFFADGSEDTFDCIIWATGFSFDYSWITVADVFDDQGKLRHVFGVSVVKGLYFVYPEKDYGFIRDLTKRVENLVKNIN